MAPTAGRAARTRAPAGALAGRGANGAAWGRPAAPPRAGPAPARAPAGQRVRGGAFAAGGARRARAVAARAGQIEVTIDKPLGLKLGQSKSKGGGLEVKNASGNAAKAGIKKGDTVIYTSSFFGDEMWPADKLSFSNSAINACPSPVSFVVVRGANNDTNVKRLPKKPAPKRFGRKLTARQQQYATHLCVDCGYIYADPKVTFKDQPADYLCPQCASPKKRFATYDPETGKTGSVDSNGPLIAIGVLGVAAVGALLYLAQ